MNSVGYTLLRKEEIQKAIEVFELNVQEYPDSSNVYDSLVEAYMVSGKDQLAIENYQRSRGLDPENTTAGKHIQWIREGIEARKFQSSHLESTITGKGSFYDLSFGPVAREENSG